MENKKRSYYAYTAAVEPRFSTKVENALFRTLPDDTISGCPAFFPLHVVEEIVGEYGDEDDVALLKEMEEDGIDYVEYR